MNILTVDLEDWFHILDFMQTKSVESWPKFESRIEENTEKLLTIFDLNNVKATFFILGWVAKYYPNLVSKIAVAGHEIACHSNNHQLVYEMSETEFLKDTLAALDHIEQASGYRPVTYRAPGFSITKDTPWAFDALYKAGIRVDCSIFPTHRAHGGLPAYNYREPHVMHLSDQKKLISLPINYFKIWSHDLVYSGGGYFRLLPYDLIKVLFAREPYNMTYFHPRDFDPKQPTLHGLPYFRRFKAYVGLHRSEGKLRKLLRDFEFVTVADYIKRSELNPMLDSE